MKNGSLGKWKRILEVTKIEVRIGVTADDKASGKLQNIDGTLKKMGDSTVNTAANMVTALNQTAGAFASLGGAVTQAANDMVTSYASFDQAMYNTQSVLGATVEEFNTLRSTAMELGKELPISALASAEGYYELASAGWETNQVLDNTMMIMKAAIAGNTDFATSAGMVTAVLGAYRDRGYDVERVTDILLTTTKRGRTTFAELGGTFPYVAKAAADMGISLEDLGASIDQVRNAGIPATMTGTALQQVFNSLAKPTDEARALMEKFSLAILETDEGGVDFIATMSLWSDQLSVLSPGLERASVMEELFGTRGKKAAGALLDNTEKMRENRAAMMDSGVTLETYDVQMQGAANQLKILEGRLENARLVLGERLLPAQIKVNEAEVWFYESLANLHPALLEYGGAILMIAGNVFSAIAPILQMIASFTMLTTLRSMAATSAVAHATAMGTETVATGGLTAAIWANTAALLANPIFWIVAIIMAVIAALLILESQFGLVSGAMDSASDYIDGLIGMSVDYSDSIDSLNIKISEQTYLVDDMRDSYSNLSDEIAGLDELLGDYTDAVNINKYAIEEIKLAAKNAGRELTDDEKDQIKGLELANRNMRHEQEAIKLQREEAKETLDAENEALQDQIEILTNMRNRLKEIQDLKEGREGWHLGKYWEMLEESAKAGEPIPKFQLGGPVERDMLGFLHAGEYVLDADITNQIKGSKTVGGATTTSYDYSNRSKNTTNTYHNRFVMRPGGLKRGLSNPIQGRRDAEVMFDWFKRMSYLEESM